MDKKFVLMQLPRRRAEPAAAPPALSLTEFIERAHAQALTAIEGERAFIKPESDGLATKAARRVRRWCATGVVLAVMRRRSHA